MMRLLIPASFSLSQPLLDAFSPRPFSRHFPLSARFLIFFFKTLAVCSLVSTVKLSPFFFRPPPSLFFPQLPYQNSTPATQLFCPVSPPYHSLSRTSFCRFKLSPPCSPKILLEFFQFQPSFLLCSPPRLSLSPVGCCPLFSIYMELLGS